MRVLVVGDLHANTSAALAVIDHAATVRADVILQLGDFGFWPRDPRGQKFLRKVGRRLELRGLELWFVDGNHEDHDRLRALPLQVDRTAWLRNEHGTWSPTLRYLPRGCRWTWGETTWVAAGGAVSMDRDLLTPGVDWFPQEELTDPQVERIIEDGPADVVVAHDAPWGVPMLTARTEQGAAGWPLGRVMASDEHQRQVLRVVQDVGAQRVFHGHHHWRYSDVLEAAGGPVQVEGLGMDHDPLAALCVLVDGDGWPILEVAA